MKHNLKYKLHELSVVVPLLNTTQNVVILRQKKSTENCCARAEPFLCLLNLFSDVPIIVDFAVFFKNSVITRFPSF